MSINGQKWFILWRHHISHLLQSFGGQSLRYEFEIWHANYSYRAPIHKELQGAVIRFFKFWEKKLTLEHFFKTSIFLNFVGQNPNNLKIRDSHCVDNSISFVSAPFVCDFLQYSLICDRYSWPLFFTQNRMTWRHWFFFQKFPGLKILSNSVNNRIWQNFQTRCQIDAR